MGCLLARGTDVNMSVFAVEATVSRFVRQQPAAVRKCAAKALKVRGSRSVKAILAERRGFWKVDRNGPD
jgi:hypothetical protein